MWPFNQKKAKRDFTSAGIGRLTGSHFAAAGINRLTGTWPATSQSMDWDLYKSLNILRARSRDLTTNNDYGKKFLAMCTANIIGPTGFSLKITASDINPRTGEKTLDKLASKAISDSFCDWSKTGNCDVTGKHSFFDICNLYVKAVARDGEMLIRKIYGKEAGVYGFQLQILDIERLDTLRNEVLANGNIIKMGVELNSYLKPVAYHIRKKHPGDNPYYTYEGTIYERIPADEIYHHFVADRPEQNRGIPWMAAAMTRLNNLGGYEEAAVIAARVGAAKMGFFTTPEGDGTALADDVGTQNELYQDAEAGAFGILPEGYGFQSFNPDYPHAMYDKFVKTCLRGVASGIGVAYNSLANDLEGVNFSSIRAGVLEERENWMVIQRWMIENFLDNLFSDWLRWALLNKAIKLPNGGALPLAKYDKFNAGKWQGRRWQWVDPLKDVEANVTAINNGLKSREEVISEQGKDVETVFANLAAEQEKMKELGITTELLTTLPNDSVKNQNKPIPQNDEE